MVEGAEGSGEGEGRNVAGASGNTKGDGLGHGLRKHKKVSVVDYAVFELGIVVRTAIAEIITKGSNCAT